VQERLARLEAGLNEKIGGVTALTRRLVDEASAAVAQQSAASKMLMDVVRGGEGRSEADADAKSREVDVVFVSVLFFIIEGG
jgi:hypothetical protein